MATPSSPWSWKTIFRFSLKLRTRTSMAGREKIWQSDVIMTVENNDKMERGVALLDTQSPCNVMSAHFARRFGLVFDGSLKRGIGNTITGDTIYSMGRVHGRWRGEMNHKRWWAKPIYFRPRYEQSTFEVIEAEDIDVIIGAGTIGELRLLKSSNRIFAPFRPLAIVDATTAAEVEKAAKERREKDRKERDENEKQKGQSQVQSQTASSE